MPTVLLIEDSPGDARLIREQLADVGQIWFRLEWVERLSTGLERLEQSPVSAIILDLSLPDSQGLATLRTIRDHAETVPVVVLTGLDDEDLGLNAVQQGAQDYLVKGQVDGPLLVRALRYAVERKRLEEEQRFLAEASAVLASSLEFDTTFDRVAHLVVPRYADRCVVDLVDGAHHLTRIAVAHRDPLEEGAMRDIWTRFPLSPERPYPIQEVLATSQSRVYAELSDDVLASMAPSEEYLEHLRSMSLRSAMIVPLIARGRTLGTISFIVGESNRCYGPHDLHLAEELAHRAAVAIDNAHLYRQAQEAVRLRDTVLSSVSHDLRNPLTAIRMIAETVRWQVEQLGVGECQAIIEGLERIDANTMRMGAQIDGLLDVAQLQMGHGVKLHRKPTDLVQIARDMVSEYQFRTARHRIRMEAEAPSIVGIWDRDRVERVVGNLLSNAVKYSPSGGEILVRVMEKEATESGSLGSAVLAVTDHGAGIPAADLPQLFTWFFRGENVAEKISGAGIGLAGSRQIVEQHGGSISVESQEHVGSTFTVELPLGLLADEVPEELSLEVTDSLPRSE